MVAIKRSLNDKVMCNSFYLCHESKNFYLYFAGQMSSIHLNVFFEHQLDAGYTKMDKTVLCPYVAWSLGEDMVIKTNTCSTMSWVLH